MVRHIGTLSLRSKHKNDIPKAIRMTPKAFDKLARELFSATLTPLGFSCENSRTCTFYRALGNGMWHIVMPDLGTRGAWYDVKVFPCCESLEPLFTARFPDELRVPTDSFCYLSSKGVGHSQEQFNCKSEENFRNRYQRTVGPLLAQFAIPYLDAIRNLEEMVPLIRSPLYRATAMYLANKNAETREMVQQQRVRFQGMGNDESVVAVRDFLDSLLGS